MRLPPADLFYLRDQYNELASQLHEQWEISTLADNPADSPAELRDAMARLVEMLGMPDQDTGGTAPPRAEVSTLGEYGLHLIDELAMLARRLKLNALATEVECLSLPLALWIARNEGEISNLAPIVNALGHLASMSGQPHTMAALYTQCCELIEAASPACEEGCQSDERHPWRLLLLNRAVVATRSLNPELMTLAFDAIVEQLPEEAQRFFAEGMEQMAVIDYPDQVREIVERYYLKGSARRRLH